MIFCAACLAITEMQMQTAPRNPLTLERVGAIKKPNKQCWRDSGEKGAFFTVGGKVSKCKPTEIHTELLQNLKMEFPLT